MGDKSSIQWTDATWSVAKIAELTNGIDGVQTRWKNKSDGMPGFCFPNVWLGVSAGLQYWAEKRIPHLLGTPTAKRFLSAEPLLGPLSIEQYLGCNTYRCDCGWHKTEYGLTPEGEDRRFFQCGKIADRFPALDWVIVGGESGCGARPMNIAWDQVRKSHRGSSMERPAGLIE